MANDRQDAVGRATGLTASGEQQRQVQPRQTAPITGVGVLASFGSPRRATSPARARPPVVTRFGARLGPSGDHDAGCPKQAIVRSVTVEVSVLDRMADRRDDSPGDR